MTNEIRLILKNKNIDISKSKILEFNIILNCTNEIIGDICLYYYENSDFSYRGNVSYSIDKQYRNKHYATNALNLLKNILQNHKYSGDKNLYISTLPENIASQKVAINNNGILFYDGMVPQTDSLYYINGIKKVKIYKIEI